MDSFREAAIDYHNRMQAAIQPKPLRARRLGIAIIGQGVTAYAEPLFRNLRAHGTYFERVKPENGLTILLSMVAARAKANSIPYGHWYIDGGDEAPHSSYLSCVSYTALSPLRNALLKNIQKQMARPGMGPEDLRTYLARLTPSDLGAMKTGNELVDRFQLKILTEGSGTQIFSTTFVQWCVREVLRRAQPLTVLARFAPRQEQRPMNVLLAPSNSALKTDPIGSLIDADLSAYYHWINQQRLPGHETSAFLVWFEGHGQALAISPSMPKNVRSNAEIDVRSVLSMSLS